MPQQKHLGIITHDSTSRRKTDYLYRISLKCFIQNPQGEVLTVREVGRNHWDLPGGGMDHGEAIKAAIARELREEVNYRGGFTYQLLDIDEPTLLDAHNFWQLRLIFAVAPEYMTFSPGEDGDEILFEKPEFFKNSSSHAERRIYDYSRITSQAHF